MIERAAPFPTADAMPERIDGVKESPTGRPTNRTSATRTPPCGKRQRRRSAANVRRATLTWASLLLAACSVPTPRPVPAPIPLAPVAIDDLSVKRQPTTLENSAPPASPWPRLRQRYAMPGCDYSPAVRQFAAQIASSPAHLDAALKTAMPFLLLVTDLIEKYDLPGEFAFLPWVESSYNMLPAHANGVAGMWQLMPVTARENGLRIDDEYDGRLDATASSRVALSLIERYEQDFGDWRLANMAFNAGENSVRAALGKRTRITPAEIERLRINKTNHEHLTKLLAVACIVSAPERYHVELPEPTAEDELVQIELPAPLDLRLAAKLAGMDAADLQRLNSAYLKARMPDRGPFHLLLPSTRRATLESTLGMLPQYTWRNWREIKLQQPQNMNMLGMAYDVDAAALARINRTDTNATLPAGTRLLLPDRGDAPHAAASRLAANTATAKAPIPDSAPPPASPDDETCTVRAGDTLWDIANRYGVRMEDLLHWNRLSRSTTLRLGQKLVLSAPAGPKTAE